MMTANWTAVRRRLAVRRTAHRPPWGGRQAGHGSIVAPLAATVAATVAVGVGRRPGTGRARPPCGQGPAPARAPLRATAGRAAGRGLRRMALGQLDLAIDAAASDEAEPGGQRRTATGSRGEGKSKGSRGDGRAERRAERRRHPRRARDPRDAQGAQAPARAGPSAARASSESGASRASTGSSATRPGDWREHVTRR